MKIALWFLLLPVHISVVLLRYPLAPIAVWMFSTADKRHLRFMRWLETLDNDLSGDSGWRNEHIKPGSDPLSTWNRIKWLWRNGGNAINYNLLGCEYDPALPSQGKRSFVKRSDGRWLLRLSIPLFGKYLELFWGWSIFGPIHGRCKYTFTTRFKG